MLDLLSSGAYDALILETPVLQYVVGTDDTCTLFLVGDPFRYFSIGLGFPVGTNDTVISAWSTAMVRQQVSCPLETCLQMQPSTPYHALPPHNVM
jgi:hypothetical protein